MSKLFALCCPVANNIFQDKRECHKKDQYCAANSICCSGVCINPLGPAGGYCK